LEFSLKELKSALERTALQKDAARRCGCISGLGAPRQQMVEHLVYASPDIAQFWDGCPYVIDFELAVRVGFEPLRLVSSLQLADSSLPGAPLLPVPPSRITQNCPKIRASEWLSGSNCNRSRTSP
jgi:hypothetical protein